MEKWGKDILSGNSFDPFGEITDFLGDTTLEGIDKFTNSWKDFKIHLQTWGFDSWDVHVKQAAANTYFFWKTGFRTDAPWYLPKKRGNKKEQIALDAKIVQAAAMKFNAKRIFDEKTASSLEMVRYYMDLLANFPDRYNTQEAKGYLALDICNHAKMLCEILETVPVPEKVDHWDDFFRKTNKK